MRDDDPQPRRRKKSNFFEPSAGKRYSRQSMPTVSYDGQISEAAKRIPIFNVVRWPFSRLQFRRTLPSYKISSFF